MKNAYMKVSEVCRELGICRQTFYKNADNFLFPVFHVGNKYIIPRDAFMKAMSGENKNEDTKPPRKTIFSR